MSEHPAYRVISARVSPMVELARWLFERCGLVYSEEAHAPVLHILATTRAGGGVEVPVVIGPHGLWNGARETLLGLDGLPGALPLFGSETSTRTHAIAIMDALLLRMLKPVRRHVYFQLLPNRQLLYPVVTEQAPRWECAFVWYLYPLWRWLMGLALGFSQDDLRAAPGSIRDAFKLVEDELARRGTPFLEGQEPGPLDIIFSALAAPVIFPAEYGAKLPALSALPRPLADFIAECRGRPAGALVQHTYRRARRAPPSTS